MILHGCSLEVLKTLDANSVDSIVTDPPYGLSFMGKKWDYDVPSVELWREALRVLKPGGHLLSFAGSRTYHRMAVNIEDAGFEIRDQIMWVYGSGFPKSQNIAIAIDKQAGAMGHRGKGFTTAGAAHNEKLKGTSGWDHDPGHNPLTEAAKKWQGWGTALKPAHEPIVVARKPIEKGLTVADNVLKHGTGAINVDAGRIAHNEACRMMAPSKANLENPSEKCRQAGRRQAVLELKPEGRWPANFILDECAASVLDEMSGTLKSGDLKPYKNKIDAEFSQFHSLFREVNRKGDSGGASRFFKVIQQSDCDRSVECKSNVDTAETTSTPLNQFVDSVRNLAAISAALGEGSSKSTIYLSTLGMLSELKQIDDSNITTIQNIAAKFLQELRRESTSRRNHANTAEIQKLIGTITIIQSLLKSSSFVEAVTSSSTSTSLELGERVSASRFAYVAKASKSERNAGLEGMPKKKCQSGMAGAMPKDDDGKDRDRFVTHQQNVHPTVKPIKLMQYLVRMVTPPGGTVLDPFCGSGSTGVAAKKLGFKFIGIEKEAEYVAIAKRRVRAAS